MRRADAPFSPCGVRRTGRDRWLAPRRCRRRRRKRGIRQAGTPLIRPSFARPPSPTRGEGTSAPPIRP
ncbi:MAG: hypothetical protein EOS08_25200, partial [Mesorhizobium sp.]